MDSKHIMAAIIVRPVGGQGNIPEDEMKYVGEVWVRNSLRFEGSPCENRYEAFNQCSNFIYLFDVKKRKEFFKENL